MQYKHSSNATAKGQVCIAFLEDAGAPIVQSQPGQSEEQSEK